MCILKSHEEDEIWELLTHRILREEYNILTTIQRRTSNVVVMAAPPTLIWPTWCGHQRMNREFLTTTGTSAQPGPHYTYSLFELLSVHLPGPDPALCFYGLHIPIPHCCGSIWPQNLAQVVIKWMDSVAVSPTDLQQGTCFISPEILLPSPSPPCTVSWATLEAFYCVVYLFLRQGFI